MRLKKNIMSVAALVLVLCLSFEISTSAAKQYELGSYKVTSVNGVKMYESWTNTSSVLTNIRQNTVLNVTQINTGYGYVRYDGFKGWIDMSTGVEFRKGEPEVIDKKIDGAVSLEIKKLPDTLEFVDGESFADTSGLVLTVTFDDNTKMDVNTGYTAEFPSLNSVGEKRVIIHLGQLTASYNITVTPLPITKIVVSLPKKTVFTVGDPIDLTGMTVRAFYSDGRDDGKGILLDENEYTVTGVRRGQTDLSAGEYTVTVTYKYPSICRTFKILVREVVVSSLQIVSLPEKTSLYQGQKFDKNEFKITATTSEGKTISVKDFDLSYNNTDIGQHTATVSYKGKSAYFSYDVLEKKQTGIEVSVGTGLGSIQGNRINLSNMTVYAKYNSGEKTEVKNYTQTNNIDINKVGTYTVTVKHNGFTAKVSYNVQKDTVSVAGDVDDDGRITPKDARMVLRASAKLQKLTDKQKLVADVDADGKITAKDARKILRKSAKLE